MPSPFTRYEWTLAWVTLAICVSHLIWLILLGSPTTAHATDIKTIVQQAQTACFDMLKGDPRLPKGADGANSVEKIMAFNLCMKNIEMILHQHELAERLK